MHTPTLAPPGWYEDVSRPGRPRFWDGYQFPDEQVTICPAGHETAMSAMFCPDCGQVPGPSRLNLLAGQDSRPGADTRRTSVTAPGGQARLAQGRRSRLQRLWMATVGRIGESLTRTIQATAPRPAATGGGSGRPTSASVARGLGEQSASATKTDAFPAGAPAGTPTRAAPEEGGQEVSGMKHRVVPGTQVPARRERPAQPDLDLTTSPPDRPDGAPDLAAAGRPCGHVRHARFGGVRYGLEAEVAYDHDEPWQRCPRTATQTPDDRPTLLGG